MKLNLSIKNILIIEDYGVMRRSIKDMLYSLGARFIDEAEDGASAISLMKSKQYEIILCDYMLGEGKNGQQILEEARHKKLIPFHCIFIIVTGHQTASLVLNTLENKPDEYLTKPFNAHQLIRRVKKSIARKNYFLEIKKDIKKDNLASAILHCDNLLKTENKATHTSLLKIRAELAVNTGDFEKASAIYNQILEQRDLAWARLGIGIIAFYQQDHQLASSIFQQVISDHPIFLESYDWLTKSYEALEQPDKAEHTIIQATEISPNSFFRQQKLALLSSQTGNLQIAERAYLALIELGKYSVHKSPADFSGLAKIYSKTNKNNDALLTLDNMCQQFPHTPEAELRATALQTEVFKKIGNSDLSQQAFERTMELHVEQKRHIPKDLQLDVARACYLNNDSDLANDIIHSLIFNHSDEKTFMLSIEKMQTELGQENNSKQLIQKAKRELVQINNKGVELFQQNKITQALAIFNQAIERMPDNKNIILNMATILLHNLKSSGITKDKLLLTNYYIKRAKQVGISPDKLGNLQLEFEKITHLHS